MVVMEMGQREMGKWCWPDRVLLQVVSQLREGVHPPKPPLGIHTYLPASLTIIQFTQRDSTAPTQNTPIPEFQPATRTTPSLHPTRPPPQGYLSHASTPPAPVPVLGPSTPSH